MRAIHFASLLTLATLSGCYTQGTIIGPGEVASETPPRLVMQTIEGEDTLIWNDLSKFGPVPADLAEAAEKICLEVGASGAWGYHPKARDLDGNSIAGGGYLCRFD